MSHLIDPHIVEEKINAIEAEMKRLDMWQSEPLSSDSYEIKEAFGKDKMSFTQWLQFIFIPKVRGLILSNGPWPINSEVSIYAAQQYLFFSASPIDPHQLMTNGSVDHRESKLVALLSEFDKLFI